MKVAFSLGSQPLSIRIGKWVFTLVLLYALRHYIHPALLFCLLGALGLCLHFYFRIKTKGWTQSYGAWHYERVFGEGE